MIAELASNLDKNGIAARVVAADIPVVAVLEASLTARNECRNHKLQVHTVSAPAWCTTPRLTGTF